MAEINLLELKHPKLYARTGWRPLWRREVVEPSPSLDLDCLNLRESTATLWVSTCQQENANRSENAFSSVTELWTCGGINLLFLMLSCTGVVLNIYHAAWFPANPAHHTADQLDQLTQGFWLTEHTWSWLLAAGRTWMMGRQRGLCI